MGTLMIKCPNTGSTISTGLQTERASFSKSAVFFARTLCPLCRAHHEWFARDAWVHDPKGRDDRIGNLARADNRLSTGPIQQLKWMTIASIIAVAGITAGYAAKSAAVGALTARNSLVAAPFLRLHQSTANAIIFPEVNRTAKGDRLRAAVSDEHPAGARGIKDRWADNSFHKKRMPPEAERERLAHCEPATGWIAALVSPSMPGRCFA